MATSPNYASTPTVGAAVLTSINGGTRAAPSGGDTIFTPGASGGEVERIVVSANATTVAGTLLIYRVISSVYYLYYELQLTVQTVTAGTSSLVQLLEAVDNPNLFPIAMPTGSTLYGVLSVAQTGIVVQAEGGSY
jgi:hypothetical protein